MAEEIYYLIDFENVGLKGLDGAEKLTALDHVHLFSTRNAPKINTATLAKFNATNLLVHEVPAKSQSVDMHLVSYLGYLLGKCSPVPRIVILSNDTDYDDIVQYWKKELGVVIKRRDRFEEPKAPTLKAAAPKAETKPAKTEAKPAKAEVKPVKAEVKNARAETKRVKAEAKNAQAEATPVKAEVKPAASETAAKSAPAKQAEKPAQSAADKAEKAAEPRDKTAVNNAVMKTLSGAKYDSETVGSAASLVTKFFAEKNCKQLIYRAIISKFGQEKGLAIYRHIKKLL